MKILLVDSPSLQEPLAKQVRDFLAPFTGPWKFELGPPITQHGAYFEEVGFDTMIKRELGDAPLRISNNVEQIERWENIFDRIRRYRNKFLSQFMIGDFVLFYTAKRNEYNWFGMFDPSTRKPNGFVQGTYREEYVKSESIFPISYETVAIPLQWRMFKAFNHLSENLHAKPIGCINDFCADKTYVMHKLQTGNICQTCYNQALAAGLSASELDQIDDILDAIGVRFRDFNQRRKNRDPYPVSVKKDGRKIFIGDSEIKLRPLDKALYLFFLNAKEDYRTTDLTDHERDLFAFYQPLYNGSDRDELLRNAGKLARNEDGLANQAVSRINREIQKLVIPELADKYRILTAADGYKRVEMRLNK